MNTTSYAGFYDHSQNQCKPLFFVPKFHTNSHIPLRIICQHTNEFYSHSHPFLHSFYSSPSSSWDSSNKSRVCHDLRIRTTVFSKSVLITSASLLITDQLIDCTLENCTGTGHYSNSHPFLHIFHTSTSCSWEKCSCAITLYRHQSLPDPCENGSVETTVAEEGQNLVHSHVLMSWSAIQLMTAMHQCSWN